MLWLLTIYVSTNVWNVFRSICWMWLLDMCKLECKKKTNKAWNGAEPCIFMNIWLIRNLKRPKRLSSWWTKASTTATKTSHCCVWTDCFWFRFVESLKFKINLTFAQTTYGNFSTMVSFIPLVWCKIINFTPLASLKLCRMPRPIHRSARMQMWIITLGQYLIDNLSTKCKQIIQEI